MFRSDIVRLLSDLSDVRFLHSSPSSSDIASALEILDPTQKSARSSNNGNNGSGNKRGGRSKRIAPPLPPDGLLLTGHGAADIKSHFHILDFLLSGFRSTRDADGLKAGRFWYRTARCEMHKRCVDVDDDVRKGDVDNDVEGG